MRRQGLRGRRRRLLSAPRASGAWGRSQGRQHCGAIKETGSALTAAGNSGPGALPGAEQTPAGPGPAPRGGREAVGPLWGSARAGGGGTKQPVRLSLSAPLLLPGGRCHLGFSPHELQPEWCLLTNSSQKQRSGGLERRAAVCRAVISHGWCTPAPATGRHSVNQQDFSRLGDNALFFFFFPVLLPALKIPQRRAGQ